MSKKKEHHALTEKAVENAQKRNAHRLSDEHLACRGDLKHRWDRIPNDGTREVMFGRLVTYECARCGKHRWDTIQRGNGSLLARNYSTPEGYHLDALANGERPVTADALRSELVSRLDAAEDSEA
ncbi:MAG: hypothetical protein MUP76_04610 [Acidimicrobiia bacterium]|nr:hypothetical protein [Acidimicrobiia bacterium]